MTACGQAKSEAQITTVDELLEQVKKDKVETPRPTHRQDMAAFALAQIFDPTNTPQGSSNFCTGTLEQGGLRICKMEPNSRVEIVKPAVLNPDGSALSYVYDEQHTRVTYADKDGIVIYGFDRDAPKQIMIRVITPSGHKYKNQINIKPHKYAVSRIDGLPPSQVSTFTEAQLKRIRASSARKKKGFASRQKTMWFKDGFEYPLKEFKKTSPFGAQRILNGIKKKPHYGVDIAAPVGTPIYAPADGVVSMADDDLYFEGAMILLDHGQGLISMYLHVSAIDVKPGQVVKRGEKIGEVGSRGRSTGPHLCWRLKWRNRHLDPELLTKWPRQDLDNSEETQQE